MREIRREFPVSVVSVSVLYRDPVRTQLVDGLLADLLQDVIFLRM